MQTGYFIPNADWGDTWTWKYTGVGNSWDVIYRSSIYYNVPGLYTNWGNGLSPGVYAHDYYGELDNEPAYDANGYYVSIGTEPPPEISFSVPNNIDRSDNPGTFYDSTFLSELPASYADSIDPTNLIYYEGFTEQSYQINYEFFERIIDYIGWQTLEKIFNFYSPEDIYEAGAGIGLDGNDIEKLIDMALTKIEDGNLNKPLMINKNPLPPSIFVLDQNYPNPFNPQTEIPYSISEDGFVEVNIYNLQGKLIKNIINEFQKTGNYIIRWDGKNDSDSIVPSGIYLFKFNFKNISKTLKTLLLK